MWFFLHSALRRQLSVKGFFKRISIGVCCQRLIRFSWTPSSVSGHIEQKLCFLDLKHVADDFRVPGHVFLGTETNHVGWLDAYVQVMFWLPVAKFV
jgi:hypothetical protein